MVITVLSNSCFSGELGKRNWPRIERGKPGTDRRHNKKLVHVALSHLYYEMDIWMTLQLPVSILGW